MAQERRNILLKATVSPFDDKTQQGKIVVTTEDPYQETGESGAAEFYSDADDDYLSYALQSLCDTEQVSRADSPRIVEVLPEEAVQEHRGRERERAVDRKNKEERDQQRRRKSRREGEAEDKPRRKKKKKKEAEPEVAHEDKQEERRRKFEEIKEKKQEEIRKLNTRRASGSAIGSRPPDQATDRGRDRERSRSFERRVRQPRPPSVPPPIKLLPNRAAARADREDTGVGRVPQAIRRDEERQQELDRRDRDLELSSLDIVEADVIEPFHCRQADDELRYWEHTGIPYIDFAPSYEKDMVLDKILYSKHGAPAEGGRMKQFQTYVTGKVDDNKKYRVRVDAKYRAKNTEICAAPDVEHFKKTSMCRRRDDQRWECLEDRVPARQRMHIDNDVFDAMLIFLQEPRCFRYDSDGCVTDVAFKAVSEFNAAMQPRRTTQGAYVFTGIRPPGLNRRMLWKQGEPADVFIVGNLLRAADLAKRSGNAFGVDYRPTFGHVDAACLWQPSAEVITKLQLARATEEHNRRLQDQLSTKRRRLKQGDDERLDDAERRLADQLRPRTREHNNQAKLCHFGHQLARTYNRSQDILPMWRTAPLGAPTMLQMLQRHGVRDADCNHSPCD